MEVFIRSLPLELKKFCGRGGGKIVGIRGFGGYQNNLAHRPTKQGSYGPTETEQQAQGMQQSALCHLHKYFGCFLGVFWESMCLLVFHLTWDYFLPIRVPCPASVRTFALFYWILLCYVWLFSLGGCCIFLLTGNRGEAYLSER